jgi:DNA-binding GntR family transcriptional regulator
MIKNLIAGDQARTKQQYAYEHLKTGIIRGEYAPGGKLLLRSIASRLGVSEIPVREALKRLEAEGMVKNTPHVGCVVTEPDFNSHRQLFEVRQLLEGYATWLAAREMEEDALVRLRQIHQEMKTNVTHDFLVAEFNYQFHDLIYSSCGNSILYNLINQTWSMVPRTQGIFKLIPNRAETSVKEHEEILLFLESRDSEKARGALMEHKKHSYDLLCRYGSSGGKS